ncbi:MAG: hypothetical protein AAFN41_07380 [Planctomycetota bacterium]
MQRTHVLTGLAASVGTLAIAAAFGFAQPDGLEPPAGPVVDTQPSLAQVLNAVNQIGTDDSVSASDFQSIPVINSGTDFVLNVGTIRLERIHALQGVFNVEDANGLQFTIFASTSTSGPRSDAVQFDFGVELEGPITFTSADNPSAATVLYKELP